MPLPPQDVLSGPEIEFSTRNHSIAFQGKLCSSKNADDRNQKKWKQSQQSCICTEMEQHSQ